MSRNKRPVSQQSPIEILKSLFPGSSKSGTKQGGKDPADRVLKGLWIAGAVGVLLYSAFGSVTSIEAGEVAVRINNITGSANTITQPGWILQLPFGVHSVYTLDASQQRFIMRGTNNVDRLNVRELTVRASDGSNFHFEDTKINFRIAGDQAQTVIADAGEGDGFLMWMRPFVRAILRDEFGRESTISVSNPAAFGEATERAKTRLNKELGEHGIVVTQIVTPRPQFNEGYEKLIEERNALSNQLEVIKSNLAAAETKRERRLAEVERDENREIQEKRTSLEEALATAVSAQADVIREVDTYRMATVGEGQAELAAATRRAEELKGQLDATIRTRKSEIDAFRTQPIERVMERLGERLKGVTIAIQPYADDSTPSRVQMQQVGNGR